MNILVDQRFAITMDQETKEFFQQQGCTIQEITDDQVEFDVSWPEVVVSSHPKVVLPLLNQPQLKLVQLTSAGYDFLNGQNTQVPICNAKGAYSEAISEFVVGRILQVGLHLRKADQQQSQSLWDPTFTFSSLRGKRVALLGTGSIATEIAKRLKPFGCKLDGFSRQAKPNDWMEHSYPINEFDQLVAQYDIIISTLPLNDQTYHYFDETRLLHLNPESILVNVGRGPVIELEALEKVVKTRFKAVILDVFELEPLPKSSCLWKQPNCYLLSHASYRDEWYQRNLQWIVKQNVQNYLKNEHLINQIEL